ncbi:MAG TPA: SpoIIE family protein phosphatase [Feifaniaceae bacterium]|nr:SpoIIE family protein phosphatase [Feifaniaceae bacterium]
MLLSSAEILLGVVDAMQDMLRVLDLSQRVVLVNRSYAEQFGLQEGRACNDMFCVSGTCRMCISKKAILTGQTQEKNKRFRGRTYHVNASPLYDSSGNPLGTVEVFRDITEQIRQRDALRAQNKRLLREANWAARMQRELFLPQGQPDPHVTVSSRYLPASSLGGDMFGCLKQKDGRIGFYVADVSGHGMAAAMITLLLANVLRDVQAASAAEFLYAARKAFLSMVQDDQLYVAMFVAMLDPGTGTLTWANAGLNAIPLLLKEDGLSSLYSPSLPLCNWEETVAYPEHTLRLGASGRLLLYTDGLLDHRSSRLTETELERRMQRQDGEELLTSLEKQVYVNHEDDVCMLHIAYESAGKA